MTERAYEPRPDSRTGASSGPAPDGGHTGPALSDDQRTAVTAMAAVAAVAVHDLRNTVGVIGNYAALLTRTVALDAATAEILDRIRSSADAANAIARGLAAYVDAGDVPRTRVDLNAVVAQVAAGSHAGTADAPTAVRLELSDPPAVVDGDAVALRIAVSEVVANAIEAGPPGGTVTVTTSPAGPSAGDGAPAIRIRVTDAGPGLPPSALASAFTVFAHARPGHHGVGLPLARRLVERHGGRVSVDPAAGGPGTTVTISLPVPVDGSRD